MKTRSAAALASAVGQSPGRGVAPAPPDVDYALTNVRIVTAPGKVIEKGTVLTHDGRIAAVGATVNIPAGVVRMDLSGHTVYPGLIDAESVERVKKYVDLGERDGRVLFRGKLGDPGWINATKRSTATSSRCSTGRRRN